MKTASYDPKGSRQLKRFFDKCQNDFGSKDREAVLSELEDLLGQLRKDHKLLIVTLRRICKDLDARTRIAKLSDVTRILIGSSYWSYAIREYAMNMSSMLSFREEIWDEVEKMSELPKEDVFKVASFFEDLRVI